MDTAVAATLKEWQSYLTAISRNLMELSEQDDIKIIRQKAKDAANGYTGLTRERAAKAVDNLDTLWRYYALLSDVIERAADIYSKGSLFNDMQDRVREILDTPVTLETKHIDIGSRKLLEPENSEKKVSLKELLKLMQESFDSTRDDFNEISHASLTMQSRAGSIVSEIKDLNDTAKRLALNIMIPVQADYASKMLRDPLGGLAQIDALSLNLEKYKTLIRSAEEDYNETIDMLNDAEGMIREIEDLMVKSQDAAKRCREVFGAAAGDRPFESESEIESLKDWLSVLRQKIAEGSLSAVKVGAKRLQDECSVKLSAAKENYDIICKDYNELLDLKGEFKALLAKLSLLRAKGALRDSSIDALVEEIQSSLYQNDVNLSMCRELVEKFNLNLKI